MRLEAFFEKFELFADAPNAVARMRELVLDLAVRGKLVGQRAADEAASALLKRIHTEKVRRKARSDLSDSELDPILRDEDFTIPATWQWVGATTPAVMVSDQGKKVQTKDILTSGKYPVVDQGKVFIRGYCNDPDRVISVTEPIILFGDHTRETKLIDFDFVVGADGVKLLQPVCIDPKYYFLALQWLPLESRGYGRHFKLLRAAKIPLPPLAEQKRIVAKVDELMALCDRLEAQQQERDTRHAALARASLIRFAEAPTPANLDFLFHQSYPITPVDLRKAILSLAVQGLLVPREPEFADWETRKLKDLTTKIGSGSTPSGGRNSYQETGVPLIRSMNVHFGGFVDDGLVFLNEDQAERLKSVAVKANDVLLNITGASIGRVATAPMSMEGARVNQHVCILRPTAEILAEFLELFLAGPALQNLIDEIQVGATREALTKAMIEQFQIPVPSVSEQRRIIAKVDQLMAMVGQLEIQLAASRVSAGKLMEAVVAELTAEV